MSYMYTDEGVWAVYMNVHMCGHLYIDTDTHVICIYVEQIKILKKRLYSKRRRKLFCSYSSLWL
jgi:hypothetical protein